MKYLSEHWEGILTILSVLVSIVSIVYAISVERKRRRLEREKRTPFSWEHISSGVKDIRKWLQRRRFNPEMIIAIPGGGMIVAELLTFDKSEFLPIYVPTQLPAKQLPSKLNKDFFVKTKKYFYHFPPSIELVGRRILILDIYQNSGETIDGICSWLIKNGVVRKNLKIAVITSVSTPRFTEFEADYSAYTSEGPNVFWPWGHAIRLIRNHHRKR